MSKRSIPCRGNAEEGSAIERKSVNRKRLRLERIINATSFITLRSIKNRKPVSSKIAPNGHEILTPSSSPQISLPPPSTRIYKIHVLQILTLTCPPVPSTAPPSGSPGARASHGVRACPKSSSEGRVLNLRESGFHFVFGVEELAVIAAAPVIESSMEVFGISEPEMPADGLTARVTSSLGSCVSGRSDTSLEGGRHRGHFFAP